MFRGIGGVIHTPENKYVYEPGKTYSCDICDTGDWLSETEVEIHKRTVHRKHLKKRMSGGRTCTVCGKAFKTKAGLIGHIKLVHFFSSSSASRVEREVFACDYCNEVFFNKDLLAIHIAHKHRTMKTYRCPLCLRNMQACMLYSHMQTRHHLLSVSLCPLCLTKRPNRAELAEHAATHLKYYHCGMCGYMATKRTDFDLHLTRHPAAPADALPPQNYERYFLPQRDKPQVTFMKNRAALTGLDVPTGLFLCVLCRALCEEKEMQEHVMCHQQSLQPAARAAPSPHACACGQTFVNSVMLKHHLFKMKDGHRAVKNGEEVESQEIEMDEVAQNVEIDDDCSEVVDDSKADGASNPDIADDSKADSAPNPDETVTENVECPSQVNLDSE